MVVISPTISGEALIELTAILCVFLCCRKVMVLVGVIAGSTVMIISNIIAMSVTVIGVGETLCGTVVIRAG